MSDEIEVPTEHAHEAIHEQAEHSRERWILFVAVSTALLAVLAAVGALQAGHQENESMIAQLQSSDQWAYYQAKGIKAAVLGSKIELLKAAGKEPSKADEEKLQSYSEDQKEIDKKARELQAESEQHLAVHNTLAKSVTAFQIAIAVSAIAVLTKKKMLWYGGLALGVVGIFWLASGVL